MISKLFQGIYAIAAAACLLTTPGCRPSDPTASTPAVAASTTPSMSTAPSTQPAHVDKAPHLGHITLGAFAPEVMQGASISLTALDDDTVYSQYRSAVHDTYGADLADMNYLSVGMPGWQTRFAIFDRWLGRAAAYGDPTIAVEPVGPSMYGAFRDDDEMRALRSVFQHAQQQGTVVWVRFASESNLMWSPYSVYANHAREKAYRDAVRWFRHYMPSNVRLVFSPLINTAYLKRPAQLQTLVDMYEPGAYDRIGGTLYATSWMQPRVGFDWYYHFMRRLDPRTPFQICELGGTYPRADEVKAFLVRVARGDWPGVEHVNLFAGELNGIAVTNHGHFGFVLPGASESYLHDLFDDNNGPSTTYDRLVSGRGLDLLEKIGSGWRSGDMTLNGAVDRVYHGRAMFDMQVKSVTDEIGDITDLTPPRTKRILITPECDGASILAYAHPGMSIQVIGWDSGAGTPLRATQISEAMD